MTCTFFGHGDCPSFVKCELKAVLTDLIENRSVFRFLVGNHGNFDLYVYNELKELKKTYSHITYYVVLAYVPQAKEKYIFTDSTPTILPVDIETIPKKYAISYRNRYMIEKSDCVVTYITRSYRGAAQFADLAKRKGKICINIAELISKNKAFRQENVGKL